MNQVRSTAKACADRIRQLDWNSVSNDLNAYGAAAIGPLLDVDECRLIAGRYDNEDEYRSRIVMARHGFGSGEYKYWCYPLPTIIEQLRVSLYPPLAKIANTWHQALGYEQPFPTELPAYLERCHDNGQTRPTPLLLKYGTHDYNCLHQDIYGPHVFPLQVAILLSRPGRDFEGGEFVVVEQRPRRQSRAEVIALQQGEAVVFAVNSRPVAGTKGTYRVKLRHGVSRIKQGTRFTLGIIFHDAA
ncbi:MAG: 2OG-Fe(II) oxygenase [Hyphomicrobiaceae bacterium]